MTFEEALKTDPAMRWLNTVMEYAEGNLGECTVVEVPEELDPNELKRWVDIIAGRHYKVNHAHMATILNTDRLACVVISNRVEFDKSQDEEDGG